MAGLGPQAREHLLPALLGLPQVRISAVADPAGSAREDMAERIGVRARFSRVEDLLASGEVDCVIAACPPQAHEEIAAECLQVGVPVFVEKPPALSLRSLSELAGLAVAADLLTGVGMNFRRASPIQYLTQVLAEGTYGQVELVSVRHVAGKPRTPMWGLDLWHSFLLAQAIHPIDLLLALAGSPPVTGTSTCRHGADSTTVAAQFDFDDGVLGTLVTGTQASRFEHRVEITTTTGATLRLDDLNDLSISGAASPGRLRGESRRWRPSPMHTGFERTGFAGELAAFVEAVSTGGGFSPSLADLIPTYQVMDQLSHRGGLR